TNTAAGQPGQVVLELDVARLADADCHYQLPVLPVDRQHQGASSEIGREDGGGGGVDRVLREVDELEPRRVGRRADDVAAVHSAGLEENFEWGQRSLLGEVVRRFQLFVGDEALVQQSAD